MIKQYVAFILFSFLTTSGFSENCSISSIIAKVHSEKRLKYGYRCIEAEESDHVKTFKAVKKGNSRLILYNMSFLSPILALEDGTCENILTFIILHEIAHHENGDVDKTNNSSSIDAEKDADRFAGNFMRKMGFTKEQALTFVKSKYINADRTSTHPSASDRRKMVGLGWNEAGIKDPRTRKVQKVINLELNKIDYFTYIEEISFRAKSFRKALSDLKYNIDACKSDLDRNNGILGEKLNKLHEAAVRVYVEAKIGGLIAEMPGDNSSSVIIGSSGYAVRHLPFQRSYKKSSLKEDNTEDILRRLSNSTYYNRMCMVDISKIRSSTSDAEYKYLREHREFQKLMQSTSYRVRSQITTLHNHLPAHMELWHNSLLKSFISFEKKLNILRKIINEYQR